jgi:hypothetical protein
MRYEEEALYSVLQAGPHQEAILVICLEALPGLMKSHSRLIKNLAARAYVHVEQNVSRIL